MTIFLIFLGWFLASIVVGSFVGTLIKFGSGSIDEGEENYYN